MRSRLLVLAAFLSLLGTGGAAQDIRILSIGTGGIGGTYYPIGGVVAQAISNPPGSRPCERGGSCGVPGLVAVAQSSHGSVANVQDIARGVLDTAFVQSDIAYWAHTASGIFEGEAPLEGLRGIASLYPESLHLVARRSAGIESPADLAGKRVSLDEPGSGTIVNARLVLEAYGVDETALEASYIKSTPAIVRMAEDELDAFFLVAGYPAVSIVELADTVAIDLVRIDGEPAERLLEQHPFYAVDHVPGGIYRGVRATTTISVAALWLVDESMDEELVYDITAALWNDATRRLLDSGHTKGRAITLESALDSMSVPLHPGAERFYREAGMM
jgi:uncharacterized protein